MIFKDYIFTTIVTVAIVVLSTIPIPEEAPLNDVPLIDKWAHMVMYGGLFFAMWVDHVVRGKRKFLWVARIVMLLYAIALGGAMELVQAYLTTCRSGDWLDFKANIVGALIGYLVCVGLHWKLKTSKDRR